MSEITAMPHANSFDSLREFTAGGVRYAYFSLEAAEAAGLGPLSRLPYSLKVLLENLLRHEDGRAVTGEHLRALAGCATAGAPSEIAFHASRVLLQDSAGLPLLADLAAMRDAVVRLGGDARRVNPCTDVDLVVDHSIMVDVAGRADSLKRNVELEYARNRERYMFLRWAQGAFDRLRIVPPGNGIVHQVNLELLAKVVSTAPQTDSRSGGSDLPLAFPDSVIGTDSHTPMVNALGVLGWGVGGIEAGAALLGQPVAMVIPDVVGVRLVGALGPGVTTTDLALAVTERLRRKGVVQKFVEFCGPSLAALPLPTRAALANMAPEYGATVGFFPIDRETLDYLRLTGRDAQHIALIEAYAKRQGLWRDEPAAEPDFADVVEIDLAAVEPSVAGPRRPQDRMPLRDTRASLRAALDRAETRTAVSGDGTLRDGDVVIAAITSCTNTSDPSLMLAAGLLARNARSRGLTAKPWVKTSFAPGSRAVVDYLDRAGLSEALDALGFQVVGFGCTTCMGNSGPLKPGVAEAIEAGGLRVAAVLSGNRNFEGRIHAQCRLNYLASPPLVVAYALAGTLDIDLSSAPLGRDADGRPVRLQDIWPSDAEIEALIRETLSPDIYARRYVRAFEGDAEWQALAVRGGDTFAWSRDSSYLRRPPFFEGMVRQAEPVADIRGARALVVLGDSITTDHISPVGAIPPESAAGRFLRDDGVAERDFNSYMARRVNHDVMVRGTFANPRLTNELVPGLEGGRTRHMPDGEILSIYDAANRYRAEGVPLVVIAGADYGVGSSRDWAAKGTRLLGVRAVIAEGFERIHRSNLIGMGVLPLQFRPGQGRAALGLDGTEIYDIPDLEGRLAPRAELACRIMRADGTCDTVELIARLDTAHEVEYFRHGGILQFMLRRMLEAA